MLCYFFFFFDTSRVEGVRSFNALFNAALCKHSYPAPPCASLRPKRPRYLDPVYGENPFNLSCIMSPHTNLTLKGGRGRAEWAAGGGGGGGVNSSAAPPSSEWTPPAARALPWWFHHFITGRTVSNLGIVWPLQMSLIQFSHQWVLLEQMSLDVSHEQRGGGEVVEVARRNQMREECRQN